MLFKIIYILPLCYRFLSYLKKTRYIFFMYSIKILKVLYCKLCVKISLEYTNLRYFSNGNINFLKFITSGDLCRVSETCLIQCFKLNTDLYDTIFSRIISNLVRMLKFLITIVCSIFLEIVTLCFKAKQSNKHSSASKALRVFLSPVHKTIP